MTKRNSRFYTVATIIFALSSILIIFLKEFKPHLVHYPTTWISQFLLFGLIVLTYFIASKGLKNKAQDFHIYYMGSMAIRFLISVFYLFLIVYFYLDQAMVIVINFFLLYFVYTSFEIYSLLSNLRAENKRREL
jgi:hypothetical protein